MVDAFFGYNIISSQHTSRGATMIKLHVECRKPQVRNTTVVVDWQLWERRHLKGILPHEAMDDILYVVPYNIENFENSYCIIFNVYVMYMFPSTAEKGQLFSWSSAFCFNIYSLRSYESIGLMKDTQELLILHNSYAIMGIEQNIYFNAN